MTDTLRKVFDIWYNSSTESIVMRIGYILINNVVNNVNNLITDFDTFISNLIINITE